MRRTVWLVTSLFAVSGSVFGATSAALPAQAATLPALMKPSASVADSVDAAANFVWINELRVAAGAPAVQVQSWAAGVAQAHSLDMAGQGLLFHNISGYMDEGHTAMDSVYLGENVAMGTNLSYAEAAIQASPPHMAILLDPKYNYVGVGAAIDATGQVWITEDFAEINSAPPVTTVAVKPAAPAPKPVAPAPKPVVTAAAPKPAPVIPPTPAAAPAPVTSPTPAPPTPSPATPSPVAPAAPAPSHVPAALAAGQSHSAQAAKLASHRTQESTGATALYSTLVLLGVVFALGLGFQVTKLLPTK